MDQTFNANLVTECIKAVKQIGYTRYVNICTGTTYDVPWGAMDVVFPIVFAIVLPLVAYVSYRVLKGDPLR
jgi:hypothetical protein